MRTSLLPLAAAMLPSVSALAAHLPRAAMPSPSPWISVDDVGRGTTVTPTVTTINGAASTISPPPAEATKSGTWTLTIAGHTITSPGLAPTATPTGSGKAGSFLVCTNYQQADAPFCMPQAGSEMYPGKMYYITWDTSYFGDPTTTAQVQITHSSGPGLTSPPVPGGQGFTTFTFSSDFLTSLSLTTAEVTFSLLFSDKSGQIIDVGPTITVREAPAAQRSTQALLPIIILPAILGAMILGMLVFCVWSYRKNKRVPIVHFMMRRGGWFGRGAGYGVRKSHSQRTSGVVSSGGERGWPGSPGIKKETNVGVELTDRDSWSPTSPGGRNVFREEVERQERQAGR